jgi:hypothetical protein
MDRGGFRAGQAVQGGLSRAVRGMEAEGPSAGRGAEGAYRVPPRRRCRRGHKGERQGLQCPRRKGIARRIGEGRVVSGSPIHRRERTGAASGKRRVFAIRENCKLSRPEAVSLDEAQVEPKPVYPWLHNEEVPEMFTVLRNIATAVGMTIAFSAGTNVAAAQDAVKVFSNCVESWIKYLDDNTSSADVIAYAAISRCLSVAEADCRAQPSHRGINCSEAGPELTSRILPSITALVLVLRKQRQQSHIR